MINCAVLYCRVTGTVTKFRLCTVVLRARPEVACQAKYCRLNSRPLDQKTRPDPAQLSNSTKPHVLQADPISPLLRLPMGPQVPWLPCPILPFSLPCYASCHPAWVPVPAWQVQSYLWASGPRCWHSKASTHPCTGRSPPEMVQMCFTVHLWHSEHPLCAFFVVCLYFHH